jgi:hypothetical protein
MEREIDIVRILLGTDIESGVVSLMFASVGLLALWSIFRLVECGTDVAHASCRRWGLTSAVGCLLALAGARAPASIALDVALLLAFAALDCWLVTSFGKIRVLPRADVRRTIEGRRIGDGGSRR